MRHYLFFICAFVSFQLSAQSIELISWNIRDFGQSRDDQELKAIAQLLRDADIIAIQEVVAKHPGGAQAVARLADELNRMGSKWDYRVSDPTASSSPHKSERYAFLWKTSKVRMEGRPRLISELATLVEREPYLAHFTVKGVPLHVLNFHSCSHAADYPQRFEIAAIAQWLAQSATQNMLFAGDMNLAESDFAFDGLYDQSFVAALPPTVKTTLKMSCVNGNYLAGGEDNIFHQFRSFTLTGNGVLDFVTDEGCHLVKDLRTIYSDHLPVWIEFSAN